MGKKWALKRKLALKRKKAAAPQRKQPRPSEGSAFGQVVAREILSQARAMDRAGATRYVADLRGSVFNCNVSVSKVLQTGGGVAYVVERMRYDQGHPKTVTVTFADPKAAVQSFAMTAYELYKGNCEGDQVGPVEKCYVRAVPPGGVVADGLAVLLFNPTGFLSTADFIEEAHSERMEELVALLKSGARAG